MNPIFVPAGGGPIAELGDHRGFVKISSRQTPGGAFALTEVVADPQGGVPPHIHTHEDETFYVLEGQLAIQIGGETITAGPGDTVFAPRGIAHAWFCVSPTPSRLLLLITPGDNFEAFALEMARRNFVPVRDMADPTLAAEFIALAQKHGIEMLPPSPSK